MTLDLLVNAPKLSDVFRHYRALLGDAVTVDSKLFMSLVALVLCLSSRAIVLGADVSSCGLTGSLASYERSSCRSQDQVCASCKRLEAWLVLFTSVAVSLCLDITRIASCGFLLDISLEYCIAVCNIS